MKIKPDWKGYNYVLKIGLCSFKMTKFVVLICIGVAVNKN